MMSVQIVLRDFEAGQWTAIDGVRMVVVFMQGLVCLGPPPIVEVAGR
jgi:hypothetical protein